MQKQKPANTLVAISCNKGVSLLIIPAFDKTPLVASLGKRQDNEMNLTISETGNRNVRQRLAKG